MNNIQLPILSDWSSSLKQWMQSISKFFQETEERFTSWQSWEPVFTYNIANVSVVEPKIARYSLINKTCFFNLYFRFISTGTPGNGFQISMPIPANSNIVTAATGYIDPVFPLVYGTVRLTADNPSNWSFARTDNANFSISGENKIFISGFYEIS